MGAVQVFSLEISTAENGWIVRGHGFSPNEVHQVHVFNDHVALGEFVAQWAHGTIRTDPEAVSNE